MLLEPLPGAACASCSSLGTVSSPLGLPVRLLLSTSGTFLMLKAHRGSLWRVQGEQGGSPAGRISVYFLQPGCLSFPPVHWSSSSCPFRGKILCEPSRGLSRSGDLNVHSERFPCHSGFFENRVFSGGVDGLWGTCVMCPLRSTEVAPGTWRPRDRRVEGLRAGPRSHLGRARGRLCGRRTAAEKSGAASPRPLGRLLGAARGLRGRCRDPARRDLPLSVTRPRRWPRVRLHPTLKSPFCPSSATRAAPPHLTWTHGGVWGTWCLTADGQGQPPPSGADLQAVQGSWAGALVTAAASTLSHADARVVLFIWSPDSAWGSCELRDPSQEHFGSRKFCAVTCPRILFLLKA